MTTTTQYYNAKPSNISNIGADILGARRHHFDTYESNEEKEHKKKNNQIKINLKDAVLAENPCPKLIASLIEQRFAFDYGFSTENLEVMKELRANACDNESISIYNKTLRAYNKARKEIRYCNLNSYYFEHLLAKLVKRYKQKQSLVEETGLKYSWKKFNQTVFNDFDYIKDNVKAVQFGNSVSDKERSYILAELTIFLKTWPFKIDLKAINWSFGARGKAGSVAYYQPSGKIISVNRDNIGSLIHEIGHYIDDVYNNISYKISRATITAYAESLPKSMSRKEIQYYCSRKEIFARAFEAYCKKHHNFNDFAQYGGSYLPELNNELTELIQTALI
jgi:hypothetical protein